MTSVTIVLVAAGVGVGMIIGWLVGRIVAANAASQLKVLEERLAAREQKVAELDAGLKTSGDQARQLQSALEQERVEHAATKQSAAEIARFRQEVAAKDGDLAGLRTELSRLQEKYGRIETVLGEERKAFEEKQALLTDAQNKLGDAFKALSAEALKSNNQSFLDLARATLDKFQDGAKSDLEKRQIAIDQLVKPVHESLTKFDTRIQEIEKARVGAYESLLTQVKTVNETQTLRILPASGVS
jgi:DNA recombination protein RmuC